MILKKYRRSRNRFAVRSGYMGVIRVAIKEELILPIIVISA